MQFITYSYPPIDQIINDPIIYRRYYIEQTIRWYKKISSKHIEKFSLEFDCSISTIYAVIKHIRVFNKFGINIDYPSQALKIEVANRDNCTCQYCGIKNPEIGQIDHVIPHNLGGASKSYNLVFACQPCNSEKWCHLRRPRNMKILALENSEWAKEFEHLFQRQERIKNLEKSKTV